MIQYVGNDSTFGRAVPVSNPFDSDAPMIALINGGHDDADRANATLKLQWAHDVSGWYQTILNTGTTPPAPTAPRKWRFHNKPVFQGNAAISGGVLLQDGDPVGDPPKPPAAGVPPVQIVAGGTDPVLLQMRDSLAAMWNLLQEIKAALKVGA